VATGRDNEQGDREEAYFARIQGHVMNAKTERKRRVSYSRITFGTLESYRDTASSLSFFFLPVRRRPDLFPLRIYFRDTARAILLFIATALKPSANPRVSVTFCVQCCSESCIFFANGAAKIPEKQLAVYSER